jgi:hypothetical protein
MAVGGGATGSRCRSHLDEWRIRDLLELPSPIASGHDEVAAFVLVGADRPVAVVVAKRESLKGVGEAVRETGRVDE